MNLNLFFGGYDTQAYKYMGIHKHGSGIEAYVWAPHAEGVDLFMSRENFQVFYPLEKVDDRGIWHLIIDDCECIYSYRYRMHYKGGVFEKADPYAFFSERLPGNASVMYDLGYYRFTDDVYMSRRNASLSNPMNIYELHINGFKHEGRWTSYRELKEELIPYVLKMGYTHIELMPVMEHPFDGSWGYQATGFFSATSRYGTPYELMDFINECHLNDIGVILDVAYVHFATDSFGLMKFDGGPCYEYNDEKTAKSPWGSYYFDMSKGPVLSYLMSSANLFLTEYHIDGLRLDAVSNIIFYEGNKNIGENQNGLSFVKRFNYSIKKEHPDVVLIAEDSTDYPNVTIPTEYNGLGFDYKWDLGWMNDTLKYYKMDPEYRQYHHNMLTFSMAYFYSEKFILPFSHDEVVHSKATIIDKMWGLQGDKFRQVRNLYLYMFTHPGKKLNFLGNDFAMFREFDETRGLDWDLLNYPAHDAFNRYFRDLCHIYKDNKAFYYYDYDPNYFKWIDADNYKQSIYSYMRYDDDNVFIVVLNMKPISYTKYRIGVPFKGTYVEVINSEKDIYDGCNMCNFTPITSKRVKAHNMNNSIEIDLAPYAGVMFMAPRPKKEPAKPKKAAKTVKAAEKTKPVKAVKAEKATKTVKTTKTVKAEKPAKVVKATKTVKAETAKPAKTVKKTAAAKPVKEAKKAPAKKTSAPKTVKAEKAKPAKTVKKASSAKSVKTTKTAKSKKAAKSSK
ncbi:MAG: 1,4-alpha-glucan branching protein GlgB [Erysipelotrichaceae bacterium]|nr:1,4-alpha-glucan branching protein GlgB [Erysipelotrichaceae bacterium]